MLYLTVNQKVNATKKYWCSIDDSFKITENFIESIMADNSLKSKNPFKCID